MFIEKLSDVEIRSYVESNIHNEWIKQYGSVSRYSDEAIVTLTMFSGALRRVTLNDFEIDADLDYADQSEINAQWKNYMFKKFGNEYKQAYNEYLKQKYESEMIK